METRRSLCGHLYTNLLNRTSAEWQVLQARQLLPGSAWRGHLMAVSQPLDGFGASFHEHSSNWLQNYHGQAQSPGSGQLRGYYPDRDPDSRSLGNIWTINDRTRNLERPRLALGLSKETETLVSPTICRSARCRSMASWLVDLASHRVFQTRQHLLSWHPLAGSGCP